MRYGIVLLLVLLQPVLSAELKEADAEKLIKASGLPGGIAVHAGCSDGTFTSALAAGERFVVQGLATKEPQVKAAGKKVQTRGLYGRVTTTRFDGAHLPYIDNMVNLLVITDPAGITSAEIMRVLVPGGMVAVKACTTIQGLETAPLKKCEGWTSATKPHPEEIDEWTHYLHDCRGTSVSNDTIAGEAKGLQWTCGPFWARSHEHTASMNAMVSAAGRLFYVMDEGPTASIQLPAENFLSARDAFNGALLWKRPLKNWFNHLYPLKSGPGWLPRRLVAIGDRVYISPGTEENLLCLDAATGNVIKEYPGTAFTFEMVVSDGVVFAAVDPDAESCTYRQENANCWTERNRANKTWGWKRETGTRVIKAIYVQKGTVQWQHEMPVVPMTLAADDHIVCVYDGDAVCAFNRKSGEKKWRADIPDMLYVGTGYAGPRLIIQDGYVVFAPQKQIFVMDAATGKTVWSINDKPRSGHWSLEDFYVIEDRIWAMGRANQGLFKTYNLADGGDIREHRNPIDSFYIHQRCFPGKATIRCLIPPIMGNTIYDMTTDTWTLNNWVRGGCIYGSMPANGMMYTGPHACACYYQSKLNGFNAVTPAAQAPTTPPARKRLLKGPAYETFDEKQEYGAAEWPVFRHDNQRSGYVKTSVAASVEQTWTHRFNSKITQPVAAGGRLFVSAVDCHIVYALDPKSGNELWNFTAGGRVDSPPTIYKGRAFFGCADGCIYAVDAADGTIAWRFQAAPGTRRILSYGQLESAWPASGSVLIQDGKLYAVAGRSMFLDGGLRLVMLDPKTGALLHENVMDSTIPGTDKNLQELLMGKHMPVAMPDILSSDGAYVYMKSQTFTKEGKRLRIRPQRPDTQYDREIHLFSPSSFLDDAWHQRTYWIYGRTAGEGWAEFQLPPKRVPYGRIMCVDDKNAYSYGRDVELLCNTSVSEYRLYSARKLPKRKVGIPGLEGSRWPKGEYPVKKEERLAPHTVNWHQLAKNPMKKLTALEYNWIEDEPQILARAMVLANDRLFIAGPRDVADEKKLWGRSNEEDYRKKMRLQTEWLKGGHGSFLQVFSKDDGALLKTYKLDALPAFDGLIAADGRLFMATSDGALLCFQPVGK